MIEEVIGNWSAGVLGAIVLAAVSSVVTMRMFLGRESLFRVPPFQLVHPWEVLAYLVLGVVGGLASLAFLKWLAYARPRVHTLPGWTREFQPAAAGLVIGLIGIKMPQVMGAGYAVIDEALHGQFTWKFLIVLALVKIFVTGISLLSGTPGGMFAPSLFIGAMLGGAVGAVEQHFFPHLTGTVATFALVGMGTFFAGFLRVPITSVFMVIELSGNYTAILPVMISTLVAYLISRSYQKVPLFDLLARQDGLVLPSIEDRREQVTLVVEDAMRPASGAIVVEPNTPVWEIARRIEERQGTASALSKRGQESAVSVAEASEKGEAEPRTPVLCRIKVGEWRLLNQGHILRLASHFRTVGPGAAGSGAAENRVLAAASVSRLNSPEETGQQGADQRQSKTSGLEEERVTVEKNVETPNVLIPEVSAVDVEFSGPLPLIFPDESLDEVLRWAGDWTVLPVVNRADLGKLEGILTLAGILRAFRSAAAE